VSPDLPEFPGRGRAKLWLRFLAAALVIVACTAGATATAGLLEVQTFVDDLKAGGTIKDAERVITRADAGDPLTLLLLGSDYRAGAAREDRRSDTMMLVRLDPDAPATTVLSIPRDLRVTFTDRDGGLHVDRKINESYTIGGEALTAEVIRRTFGIEINHIVNVNFRGFREAIDAIGCAYVDVDQRYYHSNLGLPASEQYAEIDIDPGYQKLCGQRALDYVRYRHTDSDFVRGARQQDFLRQLRSQYDARDFIDDPHELTRVVGRRMKTDKALQSVRALIELGKLIAFSAGNPIVQVALPPAYSYGSDGASYVDASATEIRRVRREFLHPKGAPKPAGGGGGKRGGKGRGRGKQAAAPDAGSLGLVDATQTGKDYAIQLGAMRIPIFYPGLLPLNGQYMSPVTEGGYPNRYRIKAPDGKMKQAYRLVVKVGDPGNYMGVQGTAWKNPPILANPSADSRTVRGRRLDLYYDGSRLRLVAWRTSRAVYWVSNTLEKRLSNEQMIAIAGSLTRLGR
jgi:polyisoprenyl-teichoic acid--peptidoglycan teichoic acid transferase